MARSCMFMLFAVLLPAVVMACAAGFEGNGGDDDDPPRVDAARIDAPTSNIDAPASSIDAPTSQIDAPQLPIDAPTMLPDGPISGACTTHAQCGAGSCCFGMLMCIPGDPLPLPPPFDCLPQ